jgi:hypothetical protein
MGKRRSDKESLTNPFRTGTATYVCYECLKIGGTFKELKQRVEGELKKREILSIDVEGVLTRAIALCKHGRVHSGGEFVHNSEDKIYRVIDKKS